MEPRVLVATIFDRQNDGFSKFYVMKDYHFKNKTNFLRRICETFQKHLWPLCILLNGRKRIPR